RPQGRRHRDPRPVGGLQGQDPEPLHRRGGAFQLHRQQHGGRPPGGRHSGWRVLRPALVTAMGVWRAIRTGAIVVVVTLAVYVAVDLGFGLYRRHENQLFPPDPNAVPGHRGQPYATSQFVIEGVELGGIMTIPGTLLLEPQAVHGRYYN